MKISGVGCWIVDYIYKDINFLDFSTKKYASKDGKNGIIIGEANLVNELENYFNESINHIINDISKGQKPIKRLGGVAIIATIGASQLLYDFKDIDFYYYANIPDTTIGKYVYDTLKNTPLSLEHIQIKKGQDTLTYILCEKEKNGESSRTFIGSPHIHPSTALKVQQLSNDFFLSDINYFGHIAWEYIVNNDFSYILKKCKKNKNITIVSTASDASMRNKKRWILGDSDDVYNFIDFIIMNKSEALHYSGGNDLYDALKFFKSFPIEGILITDGTNPTYIYSRGNMSFPFEGFIPIAEDIINDKERGILSKGDTVGCGDNFVSGVIASIALQLTNNNKQIDLKEAGILGNINGALASTIHGGFYEENIQGERKKIVENYYYKYKIKNE
ncbi:hypothetical protein PW5551_08495 [Petrotoga sp. 9PW.55.5.1]|uniref:carbohydrate kinase family protein n=1 Tax=Petrotoga sp. 9PW.55.5.1 TaxID=1308979 RepID=UPI000DC21096|nr:carbohydrate kinase family protein [Petrotoga sp. 9PW.55.5.1]RAO98638.1 hypothetical protein PW5551_08495 [Petrotoga sp. 9PW.55.5.1]